MIKKEFIGKIALMLILTFGIFINNVYAESFQVTLYKNGINNEFSCIKNTTDGGYIVVGSSALVTNSYKALIIKYNKENKIEWQSTFNVKKESISRFNSVSITNDGGYLAVGYIGEKSNGLIVKYDGKGNIVWYNIYENEYSEFKDVSVTSDGGYIVVGNTYFIDEGISKTFKNGIIVKYNLNGDVQWEKYIGDEEIFTLNSVKENSEGDYIAVGEKGSESSGFISDAVIIKFDNKGNIVWKNSINTDPLIDEWYLINSVDSTLDGGYIAVGSRNFIYGSEGMIAKFDKEGNLIWKRFYSNDCDYNFYSVKSTLDGGYIVAGETTSGFDGDELSKEEIEALLVKFNNSGEVLWENNFGGRDFDWFNSISITTSNEFIAVGASKSVDGNMLGLNKKGSTVAIMVKTPANIVNVSKISLNENSIKLKVGESFNLKALINPINATNKAILWEINNEQVATVDSNGKVIALKPGTANIIAKTVDGRYTANCIVTVSPIKVTGVKLNINSKTVFKSEGFNLIATVSPTNATNKNVIWSSSNTKVAKVDKYGKVTAVGVGTANIIAKTVDGGYTTKCIVTVKQPIKVKKIQINKTR